jgi:hypothetical protein
MASGLVCRANRPNTWLHRPACKREEKPCQLGAVHTWHFASVPCAAEIRTLLEVKRTSGEAAGCVGPTRLTHLRYRLWKSRSAAVSSPTEGVIFRSEHGRHWNETARLYHAARRRSRGGAAARPRAARALTGLRRAGGTAGAERSDLSLAGASRLSACCIGLSARDAAMAFSEDVRVTARPLADR